MEGSVQRADGRVRISAQLVDAKAGTTVWSKRYDRDLTDIFAIQDEIAGLITDEMRVQLTPAERDSIRATPTRDLAAYDLQLRARQLLNAATDVYNARQIVPGAVGLLEAAIARDPSFLGARCDLVRAHLSLYWSGYGDPRERRAAAADALAAAVRLNPEAGETHLAQAQYYYYVFRDFERTRLELVLAREKLPNDASVLSLEAAWTGVWDAGWSPSNSFAARSSSIR